MILLCHRNLVETGIFVQNRSYEHEFDLHKNEHVDSF